MMEKINMSELNCPDDVDRYPKGTVFIMDDSEKEMKIPDCVKKENNNGEMPSANR